MQKAKEPLETEQVQTLLTEPVSNLHSAFFGTRAHVQTSLSQLRNLQNAQEAPSSLNLENENDPFDASDHPIQKEKVTVPVLLLKPDGCFLRFWGLVKDAFIIYSLITSMYFLAFKRPEGGVWAMDVAVWAFFVLDISVCFFSAYEENEGELVTFWPQIALHYLKTWFLLDVLAIIPLQFAGYPDIEYYFRMVRMLKVTRAMDLLDGQGIGMLIPFFLTRILNDGHFVNLRQRHFAAVLYLLLYVSFFTYTSACIWFWYSELTAGLDVNYVSTVKSFEGKMPGTDPWEKMERSWYFMLTTLGTIGYGDYSATTVCELLLLIFVLLAGVTSYSYIMGQFNFLVGELNSLEGDRVGDFVMWLKQLEVVQGKVKAKFKMHLINIFSLYNSEDRLKSMANRWWLAANTDELVEPADSYLSAMPDELLTEIKEYLFSDIFGIYRGYFVEKELMLDVCLHFQPRNFQVGEMIASEGDTVYEVLFQAKGLVAMGPLVDKKVSAAIYFERRCVIGDYSGLFNLPHFTSYEATGGKSTLMFALPLSVFIQILTDKYENLTAELHAKVKQRFLAYSRLLAQHSEEIKLPAKPIDTRYWVPTVQRILKVQRKEVAKERNFVSLTQRSLLNTKSSDTVQRLLSEELIRSEKWKQAMGHAIEAMTKACHSKHSEAG